MSQCKLVSLHCSILSTRNLQLCGAYGVPLTITKWMKTTYHGTQGSVNRKNSISVGGGEFFIIDFFTDMFYIVKRSLKVKTTITLNHHKWKSLQSKS